MSDCQDAQLFGPSSAWLHIFATLIPHSELMFKLSQKHDRLSEILLQKDQELSFHHKN